MIDDEGNLFGVLNVIDALVVLLVLAVAVAGLALVFAGGQSPTDSPDGDTRYATLDLGVYPNAVTDRIATGDVMERNSDTLTVTDSYVTPENTTASSAFLRVELDGTLDADAPPGTPPFSFGDDPIRTGDVIEMTTSEYQVNGSVQQLAADGPSLSTGSTTVELSVENVDPAVAESITVGQKTTHHGEPITTVENVSSEPAEIVVDTADGSVYRREHPTDRDVTLVVELRTVETVSGTQFHRQPLRIGESIRLDLETTVINGTIHDVG